MQSVRMPSSCLSCARRKVRCDRLKPCSHCRRRKGDVCEYPVSINTLISNLQKTPSSTGQTDRIRRLEQYIRSLGHDPDRVINNSLTNFTVLNERTESEDLPATVTSTSSQTVERQESAWVCTPKINSRNNEQAQLVHHDEETTYIETPLWYKWSEAKRPSTNFVEPSPGWESLGYHNMLLDSVHTEDETILYTRHPSDQAILKLWDHYLLNVHPMTKLFFDWEKAPILQKAAKDPQTLLKGEQAFSFAIYFITILSLTEKECDKIIGDSKKSQLLDDFQSYIETALVTAGYITTSDLLVLQALLIYLLGMRNRARPATWFSLMGIAVRIATRMGLHRDGSFLRLPSVEAEEKRRVWWQMQHMEIMIAQILGCISITIYANWDTQMPANIEDKDMYPDISFLPTDRRGLTSMSYCLWRYHIMYLQRLPESHNPSPKNLGWLMSPNVLTAEKDEFIEQTAGILNEKFVQYCELLNPLHVMIQIGIRGFILSVKRTVHQPEVANTKISEIPKRERDDFLKNSIESLEYYILGETTKLIAPFRWFNENYFQWAGFVYIIIEAQQRASTPEAADLWDLIDRICSVHPKLTTALERPDIVAIGRLIVLAWYQRQEYLEEVNEAIDKPKCVVTMEEKLCFYLPGSTASGTDLDWNVDEFLDLDFDMINWTSWEKDGYTQVLN